MKKTSILMISLLTVFVISSGLQVNAQDYEVSSDPRLKEAKEAIDKAEDYMKKADKKLKGSPGQAQKLFEHAEDYFSKAAFLYEKLGEEYGIDVKDEMNLCKTRESRAHVMVNTARNSWRHTGAF